MGEERKLCIGRHQPFSQAIFSFSTAHITGTIGYEMPSNLIKLSIAAPESRGKSSARSFNIHLGQLCPVSNPTYIHLHDPLLTCAFLTLKRLSSATCIILIGHGLGCQSLMDMINTRRRLGILSESQLSKG